jgi:thioredoxin 1
MTNKHLEAFTDANFDREVLKSDLPVLVEFGGDWCRPCRILEPILDKVAVDYAGSLRVGVSDADANGEVATRYEIVSLPTLLVFRGGRVVARVIGAVPRKKLDSVLAQLL